DPAQTRVRAQLHFESVGAEPQPLVLNGQDLQLESLVLDGSVLQADQYRLQDETLTIFPQTPDFILEVVSVCQPQQNTSLMGLYVSGEKLFTQCEAEGFRRISWFPDRPDVMARYRVRMRANKQQFPLLLSNGNLLEQRDLPDGMHEAI